MDRLDTWRIFVAVAEQCSFTKAARSLGRSSAAVTRAVAELEKQLSTRLLNRTTRAVSLTDDGTRYLNQCRRVLSEIADLDAAANGRHQEPNGSLSITAPVTFGHMHVLPIVKTFLTDYPAVDAKLLLIDRSVSLSKKASMLPCAAGHWRTLRFAPFGQGRYDVAYMRVPPISGGEVHR
jgi:DNA-binding transcriptional LysR family regulator